MNRLNIVGMGIKGSSQLTIEGLERLQNCKKIYLFHDSDLLGFFEKMNIWHFESISDLYVDGANDTDNYQRIFDKIVSSIPVYQDVTILVQGHPRIGVTFAQWFSSQKNKLEFEIDVIPGISSFDTMINDLEMDPLERGTALLDANRILLFQNALNPYLNYFIYHICSVGTQKTNFNDPSKNNHLGLLKKYLLQFYSEDHPIIIIESPNLITGRVIKFQFFLKDIEKAIDKITFSSTMFINRKQIEKIDHSFLKLLQA